MVTGIVLERSWSRITGWKCSAAIGAGHHAFAPRPLHFHQRRLPRIWPSTVRSGRTDRPDEGLPKTLLVLERRLNDALIDRCTTYAPSAWNVAIDWHLQPYYGQPFQSRNELYYGKPKLGTAKFHAYATAASWNMDSVTRWS